MTTFSEILEARDRNPAAVHHLAVRRLLETVGDRSLTIVPDDGPVHEELKRRGYGGPFGLRVAFKTADGKSGEEGVRLHRGLTLRQAGRLGKALGRAMIYSGPETDGEVCVLPLGGGLDRFGARATEGDLAGLQGGAGYREGSVRLPALGLDRGRDGGLVAKPPREVGTRGASHRGPLGFGTSSLRRRPVALEFPLSRR